MVKATRYRGRCRHGIPSQIFFDTMCFGHTSLTKYLSVLRFSIYYFFNVYFILVHWFIILKIVYFHSILYDWYMTFSLSKISFLSKLFFILFPENKTFFISYFHFFVFQGSTAVTGLQSRVSWQTFRVEHSYTSSQIAISGIASSKNSR